ncbi:MAG: alpha/beta hydrolase, partial [Gammaproteobacteria bacterium]
MDRLVFPCTCFAAVLMSSAVSADYFIARDGTRIYYEIAGDGASIVVVSGGFLVREALDPLTQQAPVVFYDARGRGRSDSVNPDRVSLQHQVDDLEDLRIELGIDSMILLGWSGMGKE